MTPSIDLKPLTSSAPYDIGHDELAPWQQIAMRKRAERDLEVQRWAKKTLRHATPTTCPSGQVNTKDWPLRSGDLSGRQIEITETLPSELLGNLANGTWSAEEVLTAFIARTVVAHHLTNPLADTFFTKGLDRARELDRYFQTHGKPIGRLHGLPMSLKDVFNIQGQVTTVGVVALSDNKLDGSDELVTRLQDAGAVFYCKTNVPQFLMSGECVNYLYGRTSTPYNRALSAGGSSGGEGSLIALGGSPLGIGTDIAGSIRTPANFNGIYGLCPSMGRFPYHSAKYSHSFPAIEGVAGPLSRSIDGLEVYTRTIIDMRPWQWDSTCLPLPWDEKAYSAAASNPRASIGIIRHDGVMTPHPPIQRALREVEHALTAAGHEVIEIPLFDGSEGMWELATKLFRCTGGEVERSLIKRSGEPFIKELLIINPEDSLNSQELLDACHEVHLLRQLFLERWKATAAQTYHGRPVDVFILPSGAHVAPPHGSMDYFLYEAISNVIDWTCATIPVGQVDPVLDHVDPEIHRSSLKPLSMGDSVNWEGYSVDAFRDSPICLQVLGQRLTEEKVLGYLRLIDRALGRGLDYQA